MKSPRMERVLALLRSRGNAGATTKEIEDHCGVAAARDYVRRLRDAGHSINTVEEGTNKNGARVVRYVISWVKLPKPEGLSPSLGAAQGELFG